jgi:RimJ/RimL family protein N-acetyltransferase
VLLLRFLMQHNYFISDGEFGLRPVQIEDARFITELRTDPARNRFLHGTSPDVREQERWISSYMGRPNEYYFLIERARTHEPLGTIGVYNVDTASNSAEWGRWVTRPHAHAGMPGARLLLSLAFDEVGFDELYCHTIVQNARARGVIEQLGFTQLQMIPGYAIIDGELYDGLKFHITKREWHERRSTVRPNVFSRHSCL